MAKSAGRDLVLSVYNGSSYISVGGLRARSIKFDETNVDITTADSSGRWQEMLNGAGVRKCEIDASGLWDRDAGGKLAMAQYVNGTTFTARIAWPTAGIQIDASFIIDTISFDAPYDNAGAFSIKMQSTGAVTITIS